MVSISKRYGKEEKSSKKEEKVEMLSSVAGLKRWITKSVSVTILLLVIVSVLERYFHVKMLADTLLAITIVLVIAFIHEILHYVQAIRLGYKPKWWRTKFRMGIEISSHSNKKKWREDKKKIAIMPYYFAIPTSIVLVIVGYQIRSVGVLFAGVGSIIFHILSYTMEGKEV